MNDLEDQLRLGGSTVSSGVFRVDAKRALAKLRAFRLAEPHHWVLEILRAASSAKARSVDVKSDTDDIIIRFDGKEFAPEVMKDLLAQALDSTGQGDRRSARYLSLGVAGALGLNPKWIKIRSGEVALEIHPPDDVAVSAVSQKGTFIHVRKRFGWDVVMAAFENVTPEETAIREHATRYGPTLSLNEHRVDRGEIFKGGLVVSSAYESDGMDLTVGIPSDGDGGKIVFDIDGVVVAHRAIELPGRFVVAWARCDRMRRNASGSDVVDSDAAVKQVLAKIDELSLDVTRKMGTLIAEGKVSETWRTRYRDYALECWGNTKLPVRAVLSGFAIIPGLYEDWYSPNDFEREHREGRPIYCALENFPRGSTPTPIARLQSANLDPIAKLLPAKQLTNAGKLIRGRARANEQKHRWLSCPVEDLVLPVGGRYLTRASIAGPNVSGEVGMVESANEGAFVRFLCQGRFVQQGDVESLAPFRLRAIVNWQKDVPEKLWAELPSDKLWSLVRAAIDAAAEKAVLSGLAGKTRPEPGFAAHALDLIVRRATAGVPLAMLNPALREAEIFPLAGEGVTSLQALANRKSWWFVGASTRTSLLSGDPVLVLPTELCEAVAKLAPERLVSARARLRREIEIRARLDGPKQIAKLKNAVTVDIEGEGLTGQVGIPATVDSGLKLTLLREGVPIETVCLTASCGAAHAIVDCAAFVVNDDWDTVVRDACFDRALSAVRLAEYRLVVALVDHESTTIDQLMPGHAQFLAAFMRKHLKGSEPTDLVTDRVDAAALFGTQLGPVSLKAIRVRVGVEHRLWTLSVDDSQPSSGSLFVVRVRPEHADLLAELLGVTGTDATAELARLRRRERYAGRPIASVVAPAGVALLAEVTAPRVSGLVGFCDRDDRATWIDVRVDHRRFGNERFIANLPLRGTLTIEGVDPGESSLPPDARSCLELAIGLAENAILDKAVKNPAAPGARHALFLAVELKLDRTLSSRLVGEAISKLPLFACTDQVMRSARELDARKQVLFVTRPTIGEPASKDVVVIADEPEIGRALTRWTCVDVTLALHSELEARAARAKLEQRKTIAFTSQVLWRRSFNHAGLEGEVAVGSSTPGQLELLQDRRPLSVIDRALPGSLAAIVNCDGLAPITDKISAVADRHYQALFKQVCVEAEALLDQVAAELLVASEEQRRKAAHLVPLVFWLAGRKKRKPGLGKVPLFLTTENKLISLQEILDEQKVNKSVCWSTEQGTALDQSRWVWWPREHEQQALTALGKVKLKDVTHAVRRGAEVRSKKRVADLTVAHDASPREALATDRLSGEVGLRPSPSKVLFIELHREHLLLETFASEHPVGAIARINCDHLNPNSDWTRASRNKVFKQVVSDVEDAVERLVAQKLETVDEHWQPYAEAAIRWGRATGGPLAQLIPQLSVFTALDGAAITVGAAFAEHSRNGRILIAEAGLKVPTGRLVLERSELAEDLLRILGLTTEDTTALLKRSVDIQVGLEARRLESLQYQGDPIGRLVLSADGLRGELVIVADSSQALVVLAKDGIRVGTHQVGKLPIAGVVDVKGLEVNEEWTNAVLTRAVRVQLEEAADLLFGSLAAQVTGMSASEKPRAREAALAYVAERGVSSATHLDRMTGSAAALASAPLFLSEEGQWVTLRAIADQVLRTGWISIFESAWRTRDTREELVLRAQTVRDPWITALENVLGPACVERVRDVDLWRKQLAERDPPAAAPEGEGLRRLRKEMRLLRSGALGHVTPDELEDVRLRSDSPKAAIFYDAKRRLVLLDGANPQIKRALAEIPLRPERTYILLAAIYGSVNRALLRITDADEAELLASLAAHVAANPKCLEPPSAG